MTWKKTTKNSARPRSNSSSYAQDTINPNVTAGRAVAEQVGKRGWIALTHDRRIRYKPNELSAVMQHGVALLVIVGNAPFPDLARSFVNSRAVIENFLRGRKPPFIAKIYRPSSSATAAHSSAPGRVEHWYP